MWIQKLQVIALYVTDLDEALSFYVELLGMERQGDMDPGVLLKAGDLTIYLEGGRKLPFEPALERAGCAPCFGTASVRATFAHFVGLGIEVVQPYQEFSEEFSMFRITDPAGNVLEIAGKP